MSLSPPAETILDGLLADPSISIFANLVSSYSILADLATNMTGNYTFFVPSNLGFENLATMLSQPIELFNNLTDVLSVYPEFTDVLALHVVPEGISDATEVADETITTIQDYSLQVRNNETLL